MMILLADTEGPDQTAHMPEDTFSYDMAQLWRRHYSVDNIIIKNKMKLLLETIVVDSAKQYYFFLEIFFTVNGRPTILDKIACRLWV